MNKTTHYQLCQWDAEDRILRLDFNADNAALDAALKQLVDALSAESSARSAADTQMRSDFTSADTSIRTDFTAADTQLRTEYKAADTSIRTDFAAADTRIRTDFASADTKIRTDFAAADTTLRGEMGVVKLADITTTADATQVNVALSSYNFSTYSRIVVLTEMKTDDNCRCMIRVNNLATGYGADTNQNQTFAGFVMTTDHTTTAILRRGVGQITLSHVNGFAHIRMESTAGQNIYRTLAAGIAVSSLTQLNLIASCFQSTDTATKYVRKGSRIRVYGWK